MKIAFVIDTYNDSGGGGVATKRLVTELQNRGHDVKVVAAIHDNGKNPTNCYQVPKIIMPGGRTIQNEMKFYFGANKPEVLLKAFKDVDIVQIQYPFLMAKGAVEVANQLGIPCVGSFHIQPQNILLHLRLNYQIFEKFIWSLFKYFLFDRVDTMVAPSRFAKNLLLSKKVKANVISISNGVPKEYVPQFSTTPKTYKDHFVLLSVGRHAPEKRHKLIIEGVKKSKYAHDILLILAGRGELTDDLKIHGKSLPVQPIIEYISCEDKLRYLNTADLYVHASIAELESLSTAEAIACCLPSLICNSANSATSQFSVDDRLLFKADNPEDLAIKINYWYENEEELKSNEMKNKLMTKAKSYQLEASVEKYENLYKDIIAKQKGQELRYKR